MLQQYNYVYKDINVSSHDINRLYLMSEISNVGSPHLHIHNDN